MREQRACPVLNSYAAARHFKKTRHFYNFESRPGFLKSWAPRILGDLEIYLSKARGKWVSKVQEIIYHVLKRVKEALHYDGLLSDWIHPSRIKDQTIANF